MSQQALPCIQKKMYSEWVFFKEILCYLESFATFSAFTFIIF